MGGMENDELLDLALRMFAELGYDGTSTRMIADAAGIPVERLVRGLGDKAELYRKVVARTQGDEQRVVEAAIEAFTPTPEGVADLFDSLLSFYADRPRFLTLWLHRWVGDAADLTGQEEYLRRLSERLGDTIRDLVKPGIDVDHFVWTLVWCIFGFLTSGVQPAARQAHPGYRTPYTPRSLAAFRSYLRALIVNLTRSADGAA